MDKPAEKEKIKINGDTFYGDVFIPNALSFLIDRPKEGDDSFIDFGMTNEGTSGFPTGSINTIYASPVYVPRSVRISSITARVQSGATGGTNFRFALYTDDGNFYPDTLLFDSGNQSSAAIANLTVPFDAVLKPGWYWEAVNLDNTTPRLSGMPGNGWRNPLGANPAVGSANNKSNNGWSIAFTLGPYPAKFPLAATTYQLSSNAKLGYKGIIIPDMSFTPTFDSKARINKKSFIDKNINIVQSLHQRVGSNYIANNVTCSSVTSFLSITDNVMIFSPFPITRKLNIKELAIDVATSVALSSMTVGLFSSTYKNKIFDNTETPEDRGPCYAPHKLINNSISVLDTSSTGIKSWATNLKLNPGLYYVAMHSTFTGIDIRSWPEGISFQYGGTTANFDARQTRWSVASNFFIQKVPLRMSNNGVGVFIVAAR